MKMRRLIPVEVWVVFLVAGAMGFLLMALSFMLERQIATGLWNVWFQILSELGKAAFIGSTAGAVVKYLLPADEEARQPLSQFGIDTLCVNREEALPFFLRAVRDSRTKNISLIGISLREFLFPARLHEVWQAIGERLKLEEKSNLPEADRLRIRLLLLDPTCPEGDFRAQIEMGLPYKLDEDVPLGILAVIALCNELHSLRSSAQNNVACVPPVLEARIYQHGSFAFQFITDAFAIVEQYTYHDRAGGSSMPLLKYRRFSDAYEQLLHSYDIVWNRAQTASRNQPKVGVGKPLRESHLVRIFRQDDRDLLTERQDHVLRCRRPGDIIAIQALSGRFYMQRIIDAIQTASRPAGRAAKIRFLIVNPISRGAILRVVADRSPIENIGAQLRQWTWKDHEASRLYLDVHDAIRRVKYLRDAGFDIELRLSAADLPCSMFLAHDSMFVEQYAYGRSRPFAAGMLLGGEYAVFEHERHATPNIPSEEKILQSAFEVLWDSCSISAGAYLSRLEPEERFFQSELEALISQTDPEPDERSISMVILAAGYGARFSAEADRVPELCGKPKGLLPIGDRPVIDWMLDSVKGIPEIRDIVLVTNEKYFDQFEDWRKRAAEPRHRLIKIISDGSSSNDDRRGAIGALHFAVTREDIRGNVLVVGADNFFEGSFQDLVRNFLDKKVGKVVTHDEGSTEKIAGRLGVVVQDVRGKIIDFEEKPQYPKSTLASTFCYLLTKENVQHLKGYVRDVSYPDSAGEFIKHLVTEDEEMEAFQFRGKWDDIGTFAEYRNLRDSIERPDRKLIRAPIKS